MSELPAVIWIASGSGLLAVALLAWLMMTPSHAVPVRRRRYGAVETTSGLERATSLTVGVTARLLQGGGRGRKLAFMLDRAGVRRPPAEFVVIVSAFTVSLVALGLLLGGAVGALLLAVVTPLVFATYVIVRSDRRKRAFADDLDDVLSMLATNLRAGHSIVQSLDTVAQEMEDPVKTEVARAVNQVRVGRDLGEAVMETADRMDSDEFRWVAQAIAIQRQVGGNLGEVLDTVGVTIRERGRLHRQVRALSAEGRLSAWVLVALPVVMTIALSVLNPGHLQVLTESALGILMIVGAVLLMAVGGLWLRQSIKVEV